MSTEIRWPEWGSTPPNTAALVTWEGHQGYTIATADGVQVIHCESCILNHVVPLPGAQALAEYYRQQFYQVIWPDYVARYEEDRLWWEMTHRHLIMQAGAFLTHRTAPVRFLDVGAGPGIALDVAQTLGCVTAAIEPNDEVAASVQSRGHTVYTTTLEAVDGLPPQDIVSLYEVLEHQRIPEDTLLRCHALLVPEGLLIVQVPNEWNALQQLVQQVYGCGPYWIHPSHLAYFTPKMLQSVVRRCGFDILAMRTTYPMEQFLLQGRNYIGNDTIGRACHRERMQYELRMDQAGLWPLIEAQYTLNLGVGYGPSIGREIVCLARRR